MPMRLSTQVHRPWRHMDSALGVRFNFGQRFRPPICKSHCRDVGDDSQISEMTHPLHRDGFLSTLLSKLV